MLNKVIPSNLNQIKSDEPTVIESDVPPDKVGPTGHFL